MLSGPVPADDGRDEDPARRAPPPASREPSQWEPVITRPDPMTEEEWLASLEAAALEDEPSDEDDQEDPAPQECDWQEIEAGCRQIAEDQAHVASAAARLGTTGALGAIAALTGRRGPGQPGSAQVFPGEQTGPAAQFATGLLFDLMPGRPELAQFADQAAGPDDSFAGASDDQLIGVLCGWDRVEAHAAARKLTAVAELIRRRPGPGCALEGPARMPSVWDEFTGRELCAVLAQSGWASDAMLELAHDLEVKLPGTKAAFLDGTLDRERAEIIARAVAGLTPEEARAAEALVLGRAGRLTPPGLRSAITRAVIEVAPEKAGERRKKAARQARVEQWEEASGNAGLAGRELPAAQVKAADQKITAWARQLKRAGLAGSMDELRAHAYLDLLLGTDSRPRPDGPPSAIPAGLAGRINLTIPLVTLLDLADRPAEIPGLGPIDPALARDLARSAAQNPKTTWCVTVTDQDGHAIGHGCARPEPKTQQKARPPDGRDPPRAARDGPGFAFTATGQHGPPAGYGSWRLSTGASRQRDLLVTLDPIAAGQCDHRFEAKGHDPGVKLRHLSQVRHATCTGPGCRRPSAQCDFEHNIPYEAGGRSCLCNGGPKCRHDHRLKQDPRWKVDQLPDGTFRWTTPSGRHYLAEPTRYPI